MANRYSQAAKDAEELTNKQLGEELAKLGPLNYSKLNELLPAKRDKEEFAKLMALVEKETAEDKQLAYLAQNMQTAGAVVFKLLKYFV
jgi:hypothetical protein